MTTTTRGVRSAQDRRGPAAPIVPARAQRELLEIARAALRVATGIASPLALDPPALDALSGEEPALENWDSVFVTLTETGELRGCMGTLGPDRPIVETVALTAITAARHDPRFSPVGPDELPLIHVDVSILGPPVELDDLATFVPGMDGVIVERGGRRALLLPEVAIDHGWDGARMFEAVSRKAGLHGDAWREGQTRRLVFRTIRFGGPAVAEPATC
jgi:AmmeMemoRadiSam system protein A